MQKVSYCFFRITPNVTDELINLKTPVRLSYFDEEQFRKLHRTMYTYKNEGDFQRLLENSKRLNLTERNNQLLNNQ